MKLIGHAHTSDEYCDPAVEYFTVSIDQPFARIILKYMDIVRDLKIDESTIYNLEMWDFHCSFYGYHDAVDEMLDSIYDRVIEYTTLPEGINDDDLNPRVDCVTMKITDSEVWWEGYIKHTNISFMTGRIDRDTLKKIVAGKSKSKKPAGKTA